MKIKSFIRLFVPILVALTPLFATEEREMKVHPSVVSENTPIVAGKPFWVAVRLQHEPHWHTYWKNPGDSGMATKIKWDISPVFQVGPIHWPVPQRIEVPPLTSFGYEGESVFLIPITPTQSLRKTPVDLKVYVEWLECKEECFPGRAELTLSIPSNPDPVANAKTVQLFSQARAHLPLAETGWQIGAFQNDKSFLFELTPPAGGSANGLGKLSFFPSQPGLIENAAAQPVTEADGRVFLEIARSQISTSTVSSLAGVLRSENGWRGPRSEKGWEIVVPVTSGWPDTYKKGSQAGLPAAIALAFIGGLILNVMPCVLPVLSLKILGFANRGEGSPGERARHASLYTGGVLLCFWALAGLLYFLRAGGNEIGWGFQLQSPNFIVFLVLLFFALAINLFGVYEIGLFLTRLGGVRSESRWEPLFSGVLAAVVATPCTAPFMGAALGYALAVPAAKGFVVFTSLAFGMALPFAALILRPQWIRVLPKPGPWMDSLKQLMGFVLVATVVWLLWVLSLQSANRLIPVLGSTLLLAMGLWLYGKSATWNSSHKLMARLGVAILVMCSILAAFRGSGSPTGQKTEISWEPFSEERVMAVRMEGRPVFVDFTAAWCLTCQVNERVALGNSEVQQAFERKSVVMLKADWTNQDEAITQALRKLGRSGVPTYALYPADTKMQPRLLPEVLTPRLVIKALEEL